MRLTSSFSSTRPDQRRRCWRARRGDTSLVTEDVIVYTNRGETTTIKFLDPDINSGKAKILTPIVPDPKDGWTVKTGKTAGEK